MQRAVVCRRCHYVNAPRWPRCASCFREIQAMGAEERVLHDVALAGWIVPGVNAALVGAAVWGTDDPVQRSALLLAATVAASVALVSTGMAARESHPKAAKPEPPAVSPPPPPRRPQPDHLTDAELRAALNAW